MSDFPSCISAADLHDRLGDRDLVTVDCRFSLGDPERGPRDYAAGHVPGAVYLHLERDLAAPAAAIGGRHPLPDWDRLARTLGAAGIGSGDGDRPPTFVVAYDDSRFAFGARLWWLLRHLGHDRVALLDGGWPTWEAAGYPTETTAPQPEPRAFRPRPRQGDMADFDGVAARLGDPQVAIVDARDPRRYRGEWEPIDPVAGSIPGAVNAFWQEVTDERGFARSPESLRQQFCQGAADLSVVREAVVYCGSGVTACVALWAMERAGLRTPGVLYPGSWSDWCARSPVAGKSRSAAAPPDAPVGGKTAPD